jgi:hypothetical protein
VQDEQIRLRAGRDRVGTTLIVAEFNEQIRVVKLLDDCAHLPARKSVWGRSVSKATTSKTEGLSPFAFIIAPNR